MKQPWKGGRGRRLLHAFFEIGVIAKGVDGVLEIIGGVALLFVSPTQLLPIVRLLTKEELAEDPHDLVANYVLRVAQHLSPGTKLFGAIYLLSHGVIKLGLVAALLREVRWAYPAAIFVFVVFLVYQGYRYLISYSLGLLALSVLDVFVIVLTWLEYQRLRSSGTPSS